METDPIIKDIPKGLLPEHFSSLSLIETGLNNRNYLIDRAIVIKRYLPHQEATDPARERFFREKEALNILKGNPHAPKILQWIVQDDQFFLVRKWIEGNLLTSDMIQGNPTRVVDALAAIHSVNISLEAAKMRHLACLDYSQIISGYLKAYKSSYHREKLSDDLPPPKEIERILEYSVKTYSIDRLKENQVLLHGDLVFSNVLVTKKHVILIDWEYAALGSPLIDITYLITQNDMTRETKRNIIEDYQEKTGFLIEDDAIQATSILLKVMSGIWYSLNLKRGGKFLYQARAQFESLGID
ncbi:MAG: phosphotransferase family protein [Candidatus Heimdallarchaeota archaeon]